jgi:soluble lytic murein transglycosylase-like protein
LPKTVRTFLAQTALLAASVSGAAYATSRVEPVYVGREPVVQRLVQQSWRDSAAAHAPWAVSHADSAVASPRFEADRRAFVADLMRTGRLNAERAESLATYAVREAYRKKVPPALVFGVMMTENAEFRSTARSNVGAVGLMQIHGKAWVPTLGKRFGTNLRDDRTNVRYGVHILSYYLRTSSEQVASTDGALRKGLLRYNGCVRGTNTKGCHRYPDKVMRAVERYAVAQCAGESVAVCVERPLGYLMRGMPLVASR